MSKKYYIIVKETCEKKLKRILVFFNLIAGKAPRLNASILSNFEGQLTRLKIKGQHFE